MNSNGCLTRARGGSSRCDFVGVEPRLASPAPSERRPSQMAGINLALQALIDEWNYRERPYLDVEPDLSLLSTTSQEPISFIEILPTSEQSPNTDIIMVLFPWMQVTVVCSIQITLAQLKAELFERLKGMQFANFSMEASDYVFRAMRAGGGEMEPLFNEECELCKLELTLPFPMLFLYEPEGARHEKELSKNIGQALGYSLDSLEQDLSDELKSCRAALWKVTSETVETRGSGGYAHYAFPEETILDLEDECPQVLLSKIKSAKLQYVVFYRSLENEEKRCDQGSRVEVDITQDMTPVQLVQQAVAKLNQEGHSPDEDAYLLQLVGQKSYLTTETRRLLTFSSVRSSLSNYCNPMFVLRRKEIVLKDYPKPRPLFKPYYVHAAESKLDMDIHREPVPSIWTIDENLIIRPISYSNMGAHHEHNSTIVATFTFYVGPVVLNAIASKEVSPSNPRWSEPAIYTGIYMKDVPEALVLSIQLYELKREKSKKVSGKDSKRGDDNKRGESESDTDVRDKKEISSGSDKRDDTYKGWPDFFRLLKETEDEGGKSKRARDKSARFLDDRVTVTPIGWANLPLYDWKGEMPLATFNVTLWPGEPELPPNARLGPNETKIGGRSAANCRVSFDLLTTVTTRDSSSNRRSCRIIEDERWEELLNARMAQHNMPSYPIHSNEDVERLENLLRNRYLGQSMTSSDHAFVWKWRHFIAKYFPDALILLMESQPMWETRESFGEIYTMMFCGGWSRLSVGAAITILSSRNTDRLVRKFAVEQLDGALDDHTFPLFILPLIQALKSEMWAFSDLACLLLRRALSDYRIGHKLFWLLRAEIIGLRDIHGPKHELYKRIALIIEAYLRGNDDHITTVLKQVEMVEFLSNLTNIIKGCKEKDLSKKLQDVLRNECTIAEDVDSPLDPTNSLGSLIIDKCKVLGSAKLPLRLSWKNVNPFSQYHRPTYEIIFKNGDDLRQDMLVLRVLEVMDSTWKRNQLDCCLSPYPVLPTGTKVGMIGVVPNCSTIFEIQSEGGKMGTAVKSLETTFINKHVRNSCGSSSKEYLECVDRFLMSCVGYSVATFIMGIKDRHNDNIMLTRDGRLFHIDFGHILGHGKTKLGIQRDRVPFVLTEHFLCVIGKGKPVVKDAHDVTKFRQLCMEAYLMLWDARLLFLSLFTAMQSMELPELSTDADLDYLKRTLLVASDCSREKAGQYFSEIFDEAFNGSWSTKTNWFFHAVKHL